jgi:hypothetical protein
MLNMDIEIKELFTNISSNTLVSILITAMIGWFVYKQQEKRK